MIVSEKELVVIMYPGTQIDESVQYMKTGFEPDLVWKRRHMADSGARIPDPLTLGKKT